MKSSNSSKIPSLRFSLYVYNNFLGNQVGKTNEKGTETLGNDEKEFPVSYSTGINNVTVSGHVGQGLGAVLLDPWYGFGVRRGSGDNDDVFALVVGLEMVAAVFVGVLIVVDVHERYYLRHDE